jgi:hypothetical protein
MSYTVNDQIENSMGEITEGGWAYQVLNSGNNVTHTFTSTVQPDVVHVVRFTVGANPNWTIRHTVLTGDHGVKNQCYIVGEGAHNNWEERLFNILFDV